MPFEAVLINDSRGAVPIVLDMGVDLTKGKVYPMSNVSSHSLDSFAFNGDITLDSGSIHRISGYTRPDEQYAFLVKRVYHTDEDETDPVLKTWGRYDSDAGVDPWYKSDTRLFNWLFNKVEENDTYQNCQAEKLKFAWRLRAFQPFRSKKFVGKISLHKSLKDKDNDRETALKPTKAFALMFPEIPHADLIKIYDQYMKEFVVRDFTVCIGETKADFALAYSHTQAASENVGHSCEHKSMSNSCMRYKINPESHEPYQFKGFPHHPAEAYASGDFKIFYTKDDIGQIGSRCVVYIDGDQYLAGPTYGTTEQSIQMIEDALTVASNDNWRYAERDEWIGAKLLRIDYKDCFIAPYLDTYPQSMTATCCGKYLKIDSCGEIDASDYSGLLSPDGCRSQCYECECRVHDDEARYSEHTGHTYCDDCFYDNHFFCNYIHEDCHDSEGVTVYYMGTWGRDCDRYHQSIICDGDAVLCGDNEYWMSGDCIYSEYDDEWISPDMTDDYFMSDDDGEWYPISQRAELSDGSEISIDEAKEKGYVLNNETNTWNEGDDT